MDVRIIVFSFIVLMSVELKAHDIYKCVIDGDVEFSDQPLSGGDVIEVPDFSDSVEMFNMEKVSRLDFSIKRRFLKESIDKYHAEIHRLIKKMNAEVKQLQQSKPIENKRKIKIGYANQANIYQPDVKNKSSARLMDKSFSATLDSRLKVAKSKKAKKFSSEDAAIITERSSNKLSGVLEVGLANVASALHTLNAERVSDQINAVVGRYNTLIKAKEFQIGLLVQELNELNELKP